MRLYPFVGYGGTDAPGAAKADGSAAVETGIHQQELVMVMCGLCAAFGIPHAAPGCILTTAAQEGPTVPAVGALCVDPFPDVAHKVGHAKWADVARECIDW